MKQNPLSKNVTLPCDSNQRFGKYLQELPIEITIKIVVNIQRTEEKRQVVQTSMKSCSVVTFLFKGMLDRKLNLFFIFTSPNLFVVAFRFWRSDITCYNQNQETTYKYLACSATHKKNKKLLFFNFANKFSTSIFNFFIALQSDTFLPN